MTPLDHTAGALATETKSRPDTHAQFVGSIPEIYDDCLGPFLFDFAAADLAKRVSARISAGDRILEVACGTGIATEHLWQTLPKDTDIVATDLNRPMIDFARANRGALSNVTFDTADALALPFEDDTFNAVVCQFGIMFFPDKEKGIAEMTRVLKPGGLLIFNVWDRPERNEIAKIADQTVAGFFETDPPGFLKLPFSYADIDAIKETLQNSGYESIDVHVVSKKVKARNSHELARGFVEGNPGILEIQKRATVNAGVIVDALAAAIDTTFGSAGLHIPLQEIVFSAIKP